MNDYRQAIVEIAYKPPRSMEFKRWRIPVSELVAEDLHPLPRGRELPFNISEQEIAREMVQGRARIRDGLANIIAAKLEEYFRSVDPINGYSPEEWAKMHAA